MGNLKAEMIIFHRPNNGLLSVISDSSPTSSNIYYAQKNNPNQPIDSSFKKLTRPAGRSGQGVRVDLYEDVSIPLTYTILDVREPDKKKTSWSKSIKLPGTKNNNRIFTHIYELGKDGWITIGNRSVYQGFNPNIRKEVIINNDGIQVFKGNMQLKTVTKDKDGNIEYEVTLTGDLTSLFFDIGNAKLSDLDFSEWDHEWSAQNIMRSWYGQLTRNKSPYISNTSTIIGTISRLSRQKSTGRLQIRMATPHGLSVEDWVRVQVFGNGEFQFFSTAHGEWCVAEIINSTTFTVNYPYPKGLLKWRSYNSNPEDVSSRGFVVSKIVHSGKGYVYPMISWGDEYDANSFPVTSFVPAYYVKEIWDKIFAETNSSYESNFINSQFFKRLILIQKRSEYKVSRDDVKARTFRVGALEGFTTVVSMGPALSNTPEWSLQFLNGNIGATWSGSSASLFQFNQPTNDPSSRVRFNIETGGTGTGSFCDGNCDGYSGTIIYNNWDSSTYKWVVPRSGEYQLSAAFKISAWMDMNGYFGTNPNGTASFFPLGPTYTYYPYAVTKDQPNGFIGLNSTGIRVNARMWRMRQGVKTKIGETSIDFVTLPSQTWRNRNVNNPPPGWKWFGRYQPTSWENRDVLVNANNRYFNTGDEVWVEVTYFLQTAGRFYSTSLGRHLSIAFGEIKRVNFFQEEKRDILADIFVKVEPVSYMWNVPSNKSTENSIIEAKEFLPKDMSCKDFLNSIIKSFNLYIQPDNLVERKYYIEPRDDFYYTGSNGQSDYEDWSGKIQEDSIEIIPMGALISKYYTFENKSENDYWNKKFREERGRDYMKYTKEVENDFLDNETKITTNFGSTVMINNPEDSDVVMPAILQRESNGSAKPVSNSAPRLLIYGGIRPYSKEQLYIPDLLSIGQQNVSGQQGWELLQSSSIVPNAATSSGGLSFYPYAGTVDSPQDPMYDLNWFNMEEGDFVYWDNARWSDHNLYNAYWRNFITEISDPSSALIKAKVRLTPKDIFSLDFRKIIVIDRIYYRLQKIIDYDPIGDGLTTVELLKLKSSSKYLRKSVWNGELFETVKVDKGTLPISISYMPPQRIRASSGFINTSPGSNISNNPSIIIKGKGNYVGSAKNVDIVGDENAIGDNAFNINIKGGLGNAISGGVSNVTLIGTSKKVINESNVTYINNIRFKNGVPISRCNVINGGIDSVNKDLSPNSQINVINGGEDIVKKQGSNTYENVINAGIDTVLPDIPELGISSTTTPYPKTNFSGGYSFISATLSLIDVVRQTQVSSNNIITNFGESS
jgi:hypothetical protein